MIFWSKPEVKPVIQGYKSDDLKEVIERLAATEIAGNTKSHTHVIAAHRAIAALMHYLQNEVEQDKMT